MSVEKIVGIAVGVLALLGTVATVVTAYNNLNTRLNDMGDRIAKIEMMLGSAACNAILPRQIEAIEKNRKEAREALEKLSAQYECGPRKTASMPSGGWIENMSVAIEAGAMNASDTSLGDQLNAVDVLLNDEN